LPFFSPNKSGAFPKPYVMKKGSIRHEGTIDELEGDPKARERFLAS
jgi:ABC-type branched-subunit amino acid transport system ATPase component